MCGWPRLIQFVLWRSCVQNGVRVAGGFLIVRQQHEAVGGFVETVNRPAGALVRRLLETVFAFHPAVQGGVVAPFRTLRQYAFGFVPNAVCLFVRDQYWRGNLAVQHRWIVVKRHLTAGWQNFLARRIRPGRVNFGVSLLASVFLSGSATQTAPCWQKRFKA